MANTLCKKPNLKFEVKVVSVTGFAPQLEGNLFVRYYIPADGKRRLRVDTAEVRCAADVFWGELACFECWSDDVLDKNTEAFTLVFELRWRRPGLVFGGMWRSRLLGRAELAWRDVAASSERWLKLSPMSRELDGTKAPNFLVDVKIHASDEALKERRICSTSRRCQGCECDQCNWVGTEEDMFLAATFSEL